jgi:NLI interacting factor-like phosphatase
MVLDKFSYSFVSQRSPRIQELQSGIALEIGPGHPLLVPMGQRRLYAMARPTDTGRHGLKPQTTKLICQSDSLSTTDYGSQENPSSFFSAAKKSGMIKSFAVVEPQNCKMTTETKLTMTSPLLILFGGASPAAAAWWNSRSTVSKPASDLKVFLNLECLVKAKLFTSLSSAEDYEKQLYDRSQAGYCDFVRVPLFKDVSDRFYDNYAVVERRQGLSAFLETICQQYQVHLITDKTEFVTTAIINAAMKPLQPSHKHAYCNNKSWWTDRSGLERESRSGTNLPQTLWELYNDEWILYQLFRKVPPKQWERTVLIDSTLMNHVSRPGNGITIPEFPSYGSREDAENDQSLHVVAKLLQELEPNEIDVQKVLAERFNLPERLQTDHEQFRAQEIFLYD